MKYKDCEISKHKESYQHIVKQIYDKMGEGTYSMRSRAFYLVTGTGFRKRRFDSLKEAKRAVNVRQRKIDTDFKILKRDIRDMKAKIKLIENSIKLKYAWMIGD